MIATATCRVLFRILAGIIVATSANAKMSEWADVQGSRFRGEPTEIIGPFAIFRTPSGGGKRVLLRGLPPEECRLLFRELAAKPPIAARWSEGHGGATSQLLGRVSQVIDKKLQPVALASLPEPELLLVLTGANNGESWRMVGNILPMYHRLERVFPGRVATVFVGIPQTEVDYRNFVIASGMPWLIADYSTRGSLGPISRFIPAEGASMLVFSREGTPLLVGLPTDLSTLLKFTDELLEFLWAINPENPRSWVDRAQYLSVVRPIEFAEASAGPFFIGNPVLIEGIRRRGVKRISARVDVSADGSISAVNLQADAVVPAAVSGNLVSALRQHLQFLPAIDHGKPVAGTADYILDVPPGDPRGAADAVWLGGARVDVPIPSWLVLRPIHVPESDFGEIDRIDETGKVILKAMEVSKERVSRQLQLSAFNLDWFGPNGAGNVHPSEGDVQPVDGEQLTWRKLVPVDGLVDLASGFSNSDFCVGYAWTEIEVPADVDAWLGIGSDDGVKIWHNGALAVDRWIRRPSRIDDDVIPLRLKKGKNQLLIKIQNMTIDWSFICRLRTR